MDLKFVVFFIASLVFSLNVFCQQREKADILIQINTGELQALQSEKDLPLNVSQLKSSVLRMGKRQQPTMVLFDRNDLSTILYGAAYVYFLADMTYALYSSISDNNNSEHRHLIEPFDDEMKNFFFVGVVTLGMSLTAAILCTDQFGCSPFKRYNLI